MNRREILLYILEGTDVNIEATTLSICSQDKIPLITYFAMTSPP